MKIEIGPQFREMNCGPLYMHFCLQSAQGIVGGAVVVGVVGENFSVRDLTGVYLADHSGEVVSDVLVPCRQQEDLMDGRRQDVEVAAHLLCDGLEEVRIENRGSPIGLRLVGEDQHVRNVLRELFSGIREQVVQHLGHGLAHRREKRRGIFHGLRIEVLGFQPPVFGMAVMNYDASLARFFHGQKVGENDGQVHVGKEGDVF